MKRTWAGYAWTWRADEADRAVDALGAVAGRGEGRADHRVQAAESLVHERDAEVRRVTEVPVEGGRGDTDRPGDLAQTETAQALVLQQDEGRLHEGPAGLLLLDLADPGGVTHDIQ